MEDLGCVAQGHLAELRVFQHSISDLMIVYWTCHLGAHIMPRRFTLKLLVLMRPLLALPYRDWEP